MTTRRTYVAMAAAIARVDMTDSTRAALVAALVPVLKTDNRHFSADKFANACGVHSTSYGY